MFYFNFFILNLLVDNSYPMKRVNLRTRENELPSKRNGHSSFIYKGNIYTFGGQNDQVFNDFFRISLENFNVEPVPYGEQLIKRDGHFFFEYNDDFYIYGGFDGRKEYPSLFKNFEKLVIENEPTERCYFSAVIHKDTLYIYGGESPKGCLNDFHAFDLVKMKWNSLGEYKYRACHSACIVNNKMYMYGGYYQGNWLNTMEEYNISTGKWCTIEIHGELPRLGGYSCCSLNNQIYIFGGYDGSKLQNTLYMYDPMIFQFKSVMKNPNIPGRCDQTMMEYRDKIYVLGGDTTKYVELLEIDLKIHAPFKISEFPTDCIINFKVHKRKRDDIQ